MDLPEATEKDVVGAPAGRLMELLRIDIARIFSAADRITISFSGGLDSALIARLSQEFGTFECIVAGLPGSTDIANAARVADILAIPLRKVELTEESMIANIQRIIRFSGAKDPVFISFELPLIAILRESAGRVVMTGQGADELFGGYSKYLRLNKSEFSALQKSDMQKLKALTIPLENRIALKMDRRIERPFMCNSIISYARSLDADLLMPNRENKRLIRQALVHLGLDDVAGLPKKAAQYGSGTMKMMKKIARSKGLSVKGLIEELAGSAR